MAERVRDLVTGELTLDYFVRRSTDGWKLASVEWTRGDEAAAVFVEASVSLSESTSVPYGLQIAEGGASLQSNPLETTVLLLILEQIVKEKRISDIANELNRDGFSTREGMPWSPTDVFNLLPRLIETGPALLKSSAWLQRRSTGRQPH